MRSLDAGGRCYTEEIAALRARVAKLERLSGKSAGRQHADEDLDKAWAKRERRTLERENVNCEVKP